MSISINFKVSLNARSLLTTAWGWHCDVLTILGLHLAMTNACRLVLSSNLFHDSIIKFRDELGLISRQDVTKRGLAEDSFDQCKRRSVPDFFPEMQIPS